MISVYRKISGVETEICTLSAKQSEHKTAIRGLNEIQISITVDVMLPILEGDYIKLNGVNYTINRDVEYTIESDVKYSYDFVFEHPFYILLNKLYCNRITGHTSFTLTGKLRDFVELLVWCVNISPENPDGVDTGWTVGEIFNTEYKTLTFQDMYCNEVLNKLSDEFQVEYFFNNKQVNFVERIERLTDHVFEHGAGKGLYKLTQQNVDKEDTVTRLLVRGGNQNVPNGYADEEGYLKLPENYLEDFSEHAKVVERKKKFEEEFPRFVGSIATITGENNKILTCPQIDFDIAAIAVGDNARINFLTGDLMGVSMKFNWQNSNKQITLIEQEDETALAGADGTKPTIPNTSKKAKVGDEFNFTGVLMPESYVTASITRLRNKGNKYLGLFSKKRVKFTLDIDHRYMRGKPELIVGDLVVISIPQRNFNQVIRIAELGKNLHTGAISATVSNYLEENWEKYVESKVENVRNDILAKQANVRNTLETIFRDGIVTESELKSIEAILTNLSVERGQLNAQYLVVRGNVNLINKTPLETAWSNYQTAFVDVETAINNAITDKLISDAEKANIYNKISVYSTRTNEFATALENARVAIEDNKNQGVLDVVDQNKQYLQDQIDGVVDNWFFPYSPTLANYPASDWTTNTIKDRHIGDTFTNTAQAPATDAGKSWRFVKNGTVYSWTQIADSDAVLALQKAAQAQSTADGKSTTYLIQPTEYSLGDMWVLNADQTVNGIAYKSGEILTATQDSTTFVQSHWVKKVRYTDDTAVENLQIGGVNILELNSSKWEQGGISSTGIGSGDQSSYARIRHKEYFPCVSSFDYTVKKHSSLGKIIIVFYDENKDRIINRGWYTTEAVITSPSNAAYFRAVLAFEDDSSITLSALPSLKFKLEKGNKATDWSPAPEDVEASILQAKQEAENAAKSYTNTKSEAERVLAEAYADGKVTAEEQARIDDVNAKLAAAKAYAEAQDALLKTQQEAYADGVANEAELAAIAVAEAKANLARTEAEAYADGKVSAEEARAIADAEAKLSEAKTHANTIVDNLQIGGVNLIDGTSDEWQSVSRPSSSYYSNVFYPNTELVVGQTYTFSWEAELVSGANNMYINIGAGTTTFERNIVSALNSTTHAFNRRSITFTPTEYQLALGNRFAFRWYNNLQDVSFRYRKLKLEIGSKVTDWDLSKKDRQSKIDSAKQEALTAAGNAQTSANTANTAVGNLNTYVDGSFKDGVIEASEAKAIEKYINVVNTEKSNLEATYNTLYANTYLEGTPKTNLLNAKVTYFGAVDTLLNSINTAISDGKTTIAEKQAVDTNYSSYKTALASLQTAIENANKAIQTKLDTLSTDRVNNLQIGAKNLLIGSKNYSLSNPLFAGSTATDSGMDENFWILTLGTEYLRIVIPSSIQTGEKFVLSFKHTRRALSAQVFQVTYNGVNYTFNSTSGVVKSAFPLTKAAGNYIDISREAGGSGWLIRIDEIQIELGDKPTDWSPAPEDVQAEIQTAKLTAEQAQLAADGYMRARYIRDWSGRNTANNWSAWNEIKVFLKNGTNIAQDKPVTGRRTQHATNVYSRVTDNDIGNTGQPNSIVPDGETDWVRIDLGQVYYDIDYIQVWHYWADGRTYYGTKTEISTDGVNWTPVFDSAKSGTYKETAAGNIISLRPHEVLAKTLKSQAITDKFGTTIDGGLIGAVTMLLRELNSTDETAGISGIRGANRNLPAFWTGTYADAIAGTAGIIFRHNSTGKIGVLDVDANGNVKLLDSIDPSIVRLLFSKSAIPSIESIRSGSDSGSVQNASVLRNTTLTSILPETATIANNGVHMSISGSLRISAGLAAGSNYGEAYVGLSLYKNDVFYSIISQYDMILESASLTTETTPFNVSLNVPAGTYSLVLETSFLNASSGSQAGTNTATTMTWVFEASIRRFEWGTNGFMNYRPNGHIHHTEEKGLDIRGATNMPGVLLSGSVATGGGFVNSWGAKKHDTLNAQKTATGTYTVYHSVGHTGYSVQITPETDQRVYYIPTASKGASSFIVYFRNLSGTLSDSAFSFSIMGDNYIT